MLFETMKYVVIYIPGLGDKWKFLLWLQRQMLSTWRVYGLRTELFAMGWSDEKETFDERFEELLQKIDTRAESEKVVVVGASAGASAAISAYAKRNKKVEGIVSICGELRGSKDVPSLAFHANPQFKASLELMEQIIPSLTAVDRKRILTLRPRLDTVVQPDEAWLDGAVNEQMPVWGHLFGIGYAIACKGRRIARFVRKL